MYYVDWAMRRNKETGEKKMTTSIERGCEGYCLIYIYTSLLLAFLLIFFFSLASSPALFNNHIVIFMTVTYDYDMRYDCSSLQLLRVLLPAAPLPYCAIVFRIIKKARDSLFMSVRYACAHHTGVYLLNASQAISAFLECILI